MNFIFLDQSREDAVIRSNLPILMAQRRMKVIDVARALGVHRSAIDLLYKDQAKRIDLEVLNRLCELFDCTPCDILEYVPDKAGEASESSVHSTEQ